MASIIWLLVAVVSPAGLPLLPPLPPPPSPSLVVAGGLRFQRPVLVTASDPAISSGGPTGPQHAWFPDDGGVVGLPSAPPGLQAIVVGVRHSCDGCHQNPLPHPEQTFVSYDGGKSYGNLSWSSAADPQAGTIYGTATFRGPEGQLIGNCCVHHHASNRSFSGGAVLSYTVSETGGTRGITKNVSHQGQVNYSFDFAVAEFTIASAMVRVTGGGGLVQLRAFSNQAYTNVPQQSLAAFGTSDGLQWKFLSIVAHRNATLRRLGWEGPGESALLVLRDGSLLAVFRVQSCQSYWKATSTDSGAQWSTPVALGFGSARPKLQLLSGSGRPLLSGGRPGLYLWLGDQRGENWTPINIARVHNSLLHDKPAWQYGPRFSAAGGQCVDWNSTADHEHRIMGATGYTSLLELGAGRYILLYDRLANGWSPPVWKGRPGVWGARDRVFSLAFTEAEELGRASQRLKTDDDAVLLVPSAAVGTTSGAAAAHDVFVSPSGSDASSGSSHDAAVATLRRARDLGRVHAGQGQGSQHAIMARDA
eukprot:SAG25_NODE_25_length_21717_cov_29.421778_17_plen_533_part_00